MHTCVCDASWALPSLVWRSLGATACGGDNLSDDSDSGSSESESKGELVIGSAGFTEINIMAEMYAALLQDAGYETTIQTVQNRELYEPALESGEIDVVPTTPRP